jgi:hypothetical protein
LKLGKQAIQHPPLELTVGRCRSSCLARDTITLHDYSQFVCRGIVLWSLQRQVHTSFNETWSTSTVIQN